MSFNDEKDPPNDIVYWSLRLGFEKSQNAYHTFYFLKDYIASAQVRTEDPVRVRHMWYRYTTEALLIIDFKDQ